MNTSVHHRTTQTLKERYDRQTALPEWGWETQTTIGKSTVTVVGIGGLGCSVATYLALAGVGTIEICDSDVVEASNLNRQALFSEKHIGVQKAEAARQSLQELNPSIHVVAHCHRISSANSDSVLGSAQIVVDCVDNFDARYLLNDQCVRRRIPLVHAAVSQMSGQVTFLSPPETPCLRCLFPEPPVHSVVPVIGAICGLMGSIQALEVLKFLSGVGSTLNGRLLIVDGTTMDMSCIALRRPLSCSACGHLWHEGEAQS